MKNIWLGYNLKYGHKAYNSLKNTKDEILEMPVAENLILGVAIGLAMEGYYPVVFFERHDFILNCLDCLINHLDKFYQYPVCIKIVLGSKKPLDAGPQHTQDYSTALIEMTQNIPIEESKSLKDSEKIIKVFNKRKMPVIILEKRSYYK